MPQIILIFLFCFSLSAVHSQCRFVPDEYGYISDPEFHQLIKERGYQLVETFVEEEYRGVKVTAGKVLKNGNWIFVNCQGVEFQTVDELFAGEKQDDFYYIDNEGDAASYAMSFPDPDRVFNMPRQGNKVGCYRGETEILPVQFDSIEPIHPKGWYFLVTQGKKKGMFDVKGQLVIPIRFDRITTILYSDERSYAFQAYEKKSNTVTIFSFSGDTILAGIEGNLTLEVLDSSFILYREGDLPLPLGVLNFQGQRLTAPVFNRIEKLHVEGLYSVAGSAHSSRWDDKKEGIMDLNGILLLDTAYSIDIYERDKNYIRFSDKLGNSGLFDIRLRKVTMPCLYHLQENYDHEKLHYLIVYTGTDDDSKYGLYDVSGKEWLPLIYSNLREAMNDSTYIAAINGKYGVIDLHQKQLIPFQYEFLNDLTPDEYNRKKECRDSLFVFSENELRGIVDFNGRVIVKPLYREVGPMNGFFVFETNKETGVLDAEGKLVRLFPGDQLTSVRRGIVGTRSRMNKIRYQCDFYGNCVEKE